MSTYTPKIKLEDAEEFLDKLGFAMFDEIEEFMFYHKAGLGYTWVLRTDGGFCMPLDDMDGRVKYFQSEEEAKESALYKLNPERAAILRSFYEMLNAK